MRRRKATDEIFHATCLLFDELPRPGAAMGYVRSCETALAASRIAATVTSGCAIMLG